MDGDPWEEARIWRILKLDHKTSSDGDRLRSRSVPEARGSCCPVLGEDDRRSLSLGIAVRLSVPTGEVDSA